MDLEKIKADLLTAKTELEARLQRTHKHLYQKDEPVSPNFNEQVKETENDQLVRVLDKEGMEELKQIKRALSRLENDQYLQCVTCGEDIGEQRLLAIPYAEKCIKCASKEM